MTCITKLCPNSSKTTLSALPPPPSVIVFGPTGQVGRAAALAAAHTGAKVYLGMRDPTKPIPNLSPAQESALSFTRVAADLNSPASLTAAVTSTGATHAFIYLIFEMKDFMLAAVTALKAAGITFVVFLSSSTITVGIDDVKPTHPISFGHAQVEKSLREVYGSKGGYVAIRAGYFASNTKLWKGQLAAGVMKIKAPNARFDFLSAEDIGGVAGTILGKGPGAVEGRSYLEVVGPKLISQREAAESLGRVLGRELEFEEADEEEVVRDIMRDMHCPEPVARYLSGVFDHREREDDGMYQGPEYEEAGKNIEKFLGREPIRFEKWAEENKGLYL